MIIVIIIIIIILLMYNNPGRWARGLQLPQLHLLLLRYPKSIDIHNIIHLISIDMIGTGIIIATITMLVLVLLLLVFGCWLLLLRHGTASLRGGLHGRRFITIITRIYSITITIITISIIGIISIISTVMSSIIDSINMISSIVIIRSIIITAGVLCFCLKSGTRRRGARRPRDAGILDAEHRLQ